VIELKNKPIPFGGFVIAGREPRHKNVSKEEKARG
jgi:hypothetical protein